MLTQERLKELFEYDPAEGTFTRRCSRGGYAKGTVAGAFNSYYGYVHISVDAKSYKAHRLAFLYMTGEMPEGEVDHVDGNRKNNSWDNLRDVSRKENARNCCLRSDNTTGYPGVSYHKKRRQWRARIGGTHLGWFSSREEAIEHRVRAVEREGYSPRHGGSPNGYRNSYGVIND